VHLLRCGSLKQTITFTLEISRVLILTGSFAICATPQRNALAFSQNPTLAQITPDTTLGTESSVVKPNTNVQGLPGSRIEGGAVRGTNLFHSFSEFNVREGLRVYFANPAGIENILSRVTGNNLSKIFGTLGVDGGANLFLLNPNGIIFGQNAKLDIAGSFVASTANSLVFENAMNFSATNPEAPPLLTINLRPGLQYGSNQPKAIRSFGNLSVGQNLTLAAGNLDLQGQLKAGGDLTLQAQDTVRIEDSGTNPFIALAGRDLLVQGDRTVEIFALNHPASGLNSGRNMALRSANTIKGDAHYITGGNFRIEQLDGTLGNLFSPDDPIIRASGDVSFTTYTGASLHILAGGSVNISNITITGADATGNAIAPTTTPRLANVILSNGTPVVINGTTRPTLDIRAGTTAYGTPSLTGNNYTTLTPTPNTTNSATSATINIGSITINAPDGVVLLTNQYQPNPRLSGFIQVGTMDTSRATGNGGDVIIDSRGGIVLPSSSMNTSSSAGNAGNITLIGQSLSMTDGASLTTSTYGQGNAGNIFIQVDGAVSLVDSNIFSNVESGAVGNGGNINIKAGSLSLTDSAQVQSLLAAASGTTLGGRGSAGTVTIDVRDTVTINGKKNNFSSAILSEVGAGAVGSGGNINIQADEVVLSNSALLSTSTYGDGQAGNLTISARNISVQSRAQVGAVTESDSQGGNLTVNASESVELSGNRSGLFASTQGRNAGGNAGALSIDTARLIVRDGAGVYTSSENRGRGGNLTVNASESIELSGYFGNSSSGLFSETNRAGNAGNMSITTPQLMLRDGAVISASTTFGSTGKGGNLTISSNWIELSGTSANLQLRSSLLASTVGAGEGGNLQLNTDRLIVRDGAVIATSTLRGGRSGNLTINASESVDLVGTARDNLPTSLASGTAGTGEGGRLTINTKALTIQDGALVSAATYAQGTSGNLTVNASEFVEVVGTAPDGRPGGLAAGSGIQGISSILSFTGFGIDPSQATGNGGELQINTQQLIVRNGGEVSAATVGSGQGGNVAVNASNSVRLSKDGGLLTETRGAGTAGNLNISTGALTVEDGGKATVSSAGTGRAGSLDVNARTVSLNNQARLTAETEFTQGGNITLGVSDTLQVRNSEISASTETGRAGSLNVNAVNSVELSGTGGLSVEATGGGTAGNLILQTRQLNVENGSQVTVNSPQGQAGNLTVTANSLFLNRGNLTAVTGKGQGEGGANIALKVPDLILLRNESQISADALGTANGGNINIDTQFLVALPPQGQRGSDIAANAVLGNGGRVNLTAQSIFGTQFRPIQTPLNDITASSEYGVAGVVDIKTPDVDPSRGLTTLPTEFVDPSGLIDRTCEIGSRAAASQFTITGRGGLPPNPNETLNEEGLLDDLGTPTTVWNEEHQQRKAVVPTSTNSPFKPLVEAQGWVISSDGQVILTAEAPAVKAQHLWQTPASCKSLVQMGTGSRQ
jgi:filamentous hemagglutinin family protein